MLPKTAVVKESVDQMELVNVTLDFSQRIVQVSLRYGILFQILFWPTMIYSNQKGGRQTIDYKTNLFEQGKAMIIFETEH